MKQYNVEQAKETLNIKLSEITLDNNGEKDLSKLDGLNISGYNTSVSKIGRIITMTHANDSYTFFIDEDYNILKLENIGTGSGTQIADTQNLVTKTTHDLCNVLPYSWEQLKNIANKISETSSVTESTEEISGIVNGLEFKIGIGDEVFISDSEQNAYLAVVIGFNHDIVSDGQTRAGKKAGITFQFVKFLTNSQMNSSNTNSGGWANSALRSKLNGLAQKLNNYSYIETVNKSNLSGANTTQDKLWLLSEWEIFGSKTYSPGQEGNQYKYYLNGNSANKSSAVWWERSSQNGQPRHFCGISSGGSAYGFQASESHGIAPGFAI